MRKALLLSLLVSGPASAQVSINPGMSGSWFNPETPGQGMLLDVIPQRQEVVIGWFTFDAGAALNLGQPEHRWFTAEGSFTGSHAELTIYSTSGGRFNAATPVVTAAVGQATLRFDSCTSASMTFSLDGGPHGEIALFRLSPDAFCASAAAIFSLPAFFRLSGDAAGEDESGNYAECHFDLLYEMAEASRLAGLTEYTGSGGGEVSRKILDSSGAGFSFFADFFVPDVQARVLHGNRLELDGPGTGVDDSRFYLNLARFFGQLDEHGFAQGEWTCGPFDIDVGGYRDTRQTVRGSWQIEPLTDPEAVVLD